jgi:hypothetical protein
MGEVIRHVTTPIRSLHVLTCSLAVHPSENTFPLFCCSRNFGISLPLTRSPLRMNDSTSVSKRHFRQVAIIARPRPTSPLRARTKRSIPPSGLSPRTNCQKESRRASEPYVSINSFIPSCSCCLFASSLASSESGMPLFFGSLPSFDSTKPLPFLALPRARSQMSK